MISLTTVSFHQMAKILCSYREATQQVIFFRENNKTEFVPGK